MISIRRDFHSDITGTVLTLPFHNYPPAVTNDINSYPGPSSCVSCVFITCPPARSHLPTDVPPPSATMRDTVQDLVVDAVDEHCTRDLKGRKADNSHSATTADIRSAEVTDGFVYCRH